jgi:ubiquinone/menaquinone biosynthesis C-methylase UbiE
VKPEQLQATYYARTAGSYDEAHASDPWDEHYAALQIIHSVSDVLGLETFLDVGAGTGRAVSFFRNKGKEIRGVEPVQALIEQATAKGVPENVILCGDGRSLPFDDQSFDAVLECAVLHHVAEPSVVVKEMMRVARKAVFLSDSNRFGQGGMAARALKLALYKMGLWRAARYVQTRGKYYTISDGDGLAYSYSIYDSYDQLADWADAIWCLPTASERSSKSWLHPLLTSPTGLLCAIRTGAANRSVPAEPDRRPPERQELSK